MSLLLGNRGTKLYKLDDEKNVSQIIKRGTNKENVWEHSAILEGNKGTRTLNPPRETLKSDKKWLSSQLEVCIVESKLISPSAEHTL